MDKLILLERKFPTIYEIHRGEINQTKSLVLSTVDKEFAENLVKGYNTLVEAPKSEGVIFKRKIIIDDTGERKFENC